MGGTHSGFCRHHRRNFLPAVSALRRDSIRSRIRYGLGSHRRGAFLGSSATDTDVAAGQPVVANS